MKRIITFAIIVIGFIFVTGSVAAQSPAPAPVESVDDLKFPISDLGNCENYKSCLTYCEDPVNHASCLVYAKQKGFYENDPVTVSTGDIWEKTKNALGCDSSESCQNFCQNEVNHQKCDTFAKQENVTGGYVQEPDKPQYLEKAKEVLGCDSLQTCSSFCGNSANAQKCGDFANQVGLLGGQVTQGPGGCGSNQTCGSFCSDPNNFEKCRSYAPNTNFQGPGGCTNPGSCRSHCEQNPSDCRSYSPGSNGVYVPISCPNGQYFGPGGVCTSNEKTQEAGACAQGGKFWNGASCQDSAPNGIHPTVGGAYFQPRADMGNCKTPGECYDYCKENPGKCSGFNSGSEKPKDNYIPYLYYTPGTEVKFEPKTDMGNCSSPGGCYDYCKENPGKCEGFDSKAPRPEDTYMAGTYYTPPTDYAYFTPSATNFYTTPIYYTPPVGSNYVTPTYYTPGSYSTPSYYSPSTYYSNYTTPTYYTPGTYYATPSDGHYPTPNYTTPVYYTPPVGSNYNTPSYYSPAQYVTPNYYTPPAGSNYTTPIYNTPSVYNTPSYYSPATYYSPNSSDGYFSPPTYPSPSYVYPSPSGTGVNYYTPNSSYTYPSPTDGYSTPSSSNQYPAPPGYGTPTYNTPPYDTPAYGTPTYNTPSYNSPSEYPTPPVQGASTERSLWQQFLDFLSNR